MNRVGKLLIANPGFPEDSPFYRNVIYIHDDQPGGTFGLRLNQPYGSVTRFCDQSGIMFPDNKPMMHAGGPVNSAAVIILHSDEWESTNTTPNHNGLSISSDAHMFHKMSSGNEPVYWRAFQGMCAWRPGQLNKELNGDAPYNTSMWLVADPNDDVIFNYAGDDQWVKAVDLCSQQTINHFF